MSRGKIYVIVKLFPFKLSTSSFLNRFHLIINFILKVQDFSQVSNIYYLPIINEMSTTIEIIDDTAVISNDVTFETYEKCITKLAVPKGTKSKNKVDWPVFKI